MFGRRRERMTHARLARNEFGEGLDHMKRATAHAMGGVGETVGPRVAAVRSYMRPTVVVPLAALVKSGGRQAHKAQDQMLRLKKQSKRRPRRWSRLAGLLAAGAVVGAAGAALRRRRAQQWTEYDAEHAFDTVHSPTGSGEGTLDSASRSLDKAMDTAGKSAEKAAGAVSAAVEKGGEKLSGTLGAAQDKVGAGTETVKRSAERTGEKAENLISKAGSPSRNSHS